MYSRLGLAHKESTDDQPDSSCVRSKLIIMPVKVDTVSVIIWATMASDANVYDS